MKLKREKRKYPRILLITPTYEPQEALLHDVLWNIANQDYPPERYRSLIVVNNSSLRFENEISILTYDLEKEHNKEGLFNIWNVGPLRMIDGYKGSISSQALNIAQGYAIEEKFDYILVVVGDVVLPQNTLTEMLKPFRKFKDCGVSCLTCYMRFEEKNIKDFVEAAAPGQPIDNPKIPMVIGLKKKITSREYGSKKYLKCRAGDGAMMIPRKVFTEISWRLLKKDGELGNDYAYCFDVTEKLGLWTYINTTIYTPHLNVKKNGEINFY